MKTKNTKDDLIISHLEYIRNRVDQINGRVNKAENDITAIKTTGVTLSALIGVILTWLGVNK
tara:strand:+ start:840 stop:1025 length:186 start_codon:yes stop_codon:yes gene_type:complete